MRLARFTVYMIPFEKTLPRQMKRLNVGADSVKSPRERGQFY